MDLDVACGRTQMVIQTKTKEKVAGQRGKKVHEQSMYQDKEPVGSN